MTKYEAELMLRAAEEIGWIREANSKMNLRLQMFDDLMLLFTSRPKDSNQGYTEDIRGQLQKYVQNNTPLDAPEVDPSK